MSLYLLDTNVVSELSRDAPSSAVVRFLRTHRQTAMSVITMHELAFGIARLSEIKRRRQMDAWLTDIRAHFSDRVFSVDATVGDRAAEMRAEAERKGRILGIADALIAATADTHSCVLATRNIRDFDMLALHLVDPWSE